MIETSVFDAQFVAMKVGVDTLYAIQYKLRIMGILISGAPYIYGHNMLIIDESTLKKKCNSIAYHSIHKFVAMRQSLTGYIRSGDNPANSLTNGVIGQKKKHIVSFIV